MNSLLWQKIKTTKNQIHQLLPLIKKMCAKIGFLTLKNRNQKLFKIVIKQFNHTKS